MHVTTRENDKEKENNKTNLHSAVTIKMSLLEWKKLAKQKTELGNKINFVHDTILKN